MNKRWQVECFECKKKMSFDDEKDISHAGWNVLAWLVPSGEPLCTCKDCEYNTQPTKKKN